MQTFVDVHADPEIAGAFRQSIGTGALVRIPAVRIVVSTVLLDADLVLSHPQRSLDDDHRPAFHNLSDEPPTVHSKDLIEPIDHVDDLYYGETGLLRIW